MPPAPPIRYRPVLEQTNEVIAALAAHAQEMIGDAVRRLGGLPEPAGSARGPEEAPLYVFDSAWAMQDHLSRAVGQGAGAGASGVFYRSPDTGPGVALYTREQPVLDAMTTIQHECFHHAAHRVFGGELPRWIDEGLAQTFQDAFWSAGRRAEGAVNPDRLERLRDPGYRRLGAAELLQTPDEAWFESPAQSRIEVSRLYENAWLLVFALVNGPDPDLRRAFATYLGALRLPGADHARAWRLTVGRFDPGRLDDAADQTLAACSPPRSATR